MIARGPIALALPLLAALLALLVGARDAGATANIALQFDPPNPQAGEVFRLYYRLTVDDEADPEVLPFNFGGLQVLGDPGPPRLGGGIMFSFGGGFGMRGRGSMRMSLQTSGAYLLRAPAPGRFTITNIKIVNSATQRLIYQHPSLTVTVGGTAAGAGPVPTADTDADAGAGGSTNGAGTASQQPLESPDAPPRGDLSGAVFNNQAFVRVALDPPEPYLGQQVTLRAWLYAPTSETRCEVAREPSLTGFWSQTVDDGGPCASQWFTREIAGRYWAAGLIHKVILFPSQVGTLTVGDMAVNLESATANLWNPYLRMQASSPALQVTVRDAPAEGRPEGYVPGTVGPVMLTATLDRSEVPVGETVTLTVRADSQGSLASANVVVPEHIDGLRVRRGGVREFHRVENGRVVNTLVTEVLLVPERAGGFDLGSVRVPYWDPGAGRYGVADALVPTVRASGAALPSEHRAQEQEDPAMELRPLVDAPALRPHTVLFRDRRAGLAAVLFPPVALALWAAGTALSRRLARGRIARAEQRSADPEAALADARAALGTDPARALSLAARALDLAITLEGGSLEIPERARAAVTEARAACNTARFAGGDSPEGAADVVASVARALAALEGEGEGATP